MGNTTECIETVMNGDRVYLLDAKPSEQSPLIGVLSVGDYASRLQIVIDPEDPRDSRAMFDSEDQYSTLSPEELDAHAAYAAAGLLSLERLVDLVPVTAYQDMRDLQPQSEDLPRTA